MGTRVLSLWLPYLAIDRSRRDEDRQAPGRKSLPHAACLLDREDQPLTALCPRAERAGLWPGMASAEALRRVPGLVTVPADPDADSRLLQDCVSWCEGFTPFVAVDRSFAEEKGAALWLDIGSSAHLAGGEASLLASLLGRFRRKGLLAKAAIADHPGSAWAACRFGGDERRILTAGSARVALAPWPLAALRLAKDDCRRLESAGFDRIEHLYALPRRTLAERFGDQVAIRLDQALGLVDEPIAADTPLPAQQAQMIFADPISDAKDLPALIERLLRQLCIGLEAVGLGAKRLTLALYRVDNSAVTCSIGAERPSRDMRRFAASFGDQFKKIDLGFGLERVILDAVEIEPLISERIRWRGLGTAADETLPDLAQHDRERSAGLRQPARRDVWAHGDHQRPAPRPLPPFLSPGPSGSAAVALAPSPAAIAEPALRETPPRPLRLLRQPESIEAIASLPGEPPVLFRWRRSLHKVVGARGPETVAPDWWRPPEAKRPPSPEKRERQAHDDPPARDYFVVEDAEGARFWLFREGHADGKAAAMPRWFLHGMFG